jgi:hypothetical protein
MSWPCRWWARESRDASLENTSIAEPEKDLVVTRPEVISAEPEHVAIEAAFRSEAAVQTAVTQNLTPLAAHAQAVTNRVNEAFALFKPSAPLAHEPERRNYIEPGADVAAAVDKVVEDHVAEVRDSETKPAITFRRRDALPAGEKDSVSLGELMQVIEAKSRGTSIVSRPAAPPCRAKAGADDILAAVEADGHGVVATPGAAVVAGAPLDDAQFVRDSVSLQMHSATSPEARLEYGTMPKIPNTAGDDAVQGRLLDTFELRPGASDVTSYHDFHSLQIAFEHVWSQIFDGELEALGRDLYREYVHLKDFCGSNAADLSVSTLADLSNLMQEVRRLSERVEQQMPAGLAGQPDPSGGAKSAKDLEDAAKAGLAVATGGVSALVEWAVEEFSKIGRKPVIPWESFPGPWPPRRDRIEHAITPGVLPAPLVEIALRTDNGSHLKIVELELFDEPTKTFVHGPRIDNGGNRTLVSMQVPTPFLATGVIEFASEETPGLNLGRYILSNLSRSIPGGSRVTFYWKDS